MKREAITHTKMKRLCRKLDIPQWQAVGLMETIWHLTARETPRGDLGKLSDEDIALALDYRGDESKLIEALVSAGWLDRSETSRLIVHHWSEHADDASRRCYLGSKKSRRWKRLKAAGGEIATAVRAFVFARDRKACVKCLAEADLTIDHKIPISKGGTNALDNLQTVCRRCNGRKKDQLEVLYG